MPAKKSNPTKTNTIFSTRSRIIVLYSFGCYTAPSSPCGLLRGACRHSVGLRLGRHDDPAHDVSQQAASAKDRCQHPDQPDKSNVEVEEFRQPESHPGNLPAGDEAHQPNPGYGRSHPPAAIGAKIGVFLNDFSAIVAVHESPSIRWSTIRWTRIKSSHLCAWRLLATLATSVDSGCLRRRRLVEQFNGERAVRDRGPGTQRGCQHGSFGNFLASGAGAFCGASVHI